MSCFCYMFSTCKKVIKIVWKTNKICQKNPSAELKRGSVRCSTKYVANTPAAQHIYICTWILMLLINILKGKKLEHRVSSLINICLCLYGSLCVYADYFMEQHSDLCLRRWHHWHIINHLLLNRWCVFEFLNVTQGTLRCHNAFVYHLAS